MAASPQPGAVVVTLPSQVRIRFVAPVEGRLAVLEYWQDRRIVSGPVRVDANDPQLITAPIPHLGVQVGTGWVRYRVLTGDGHVFAGVYPVQIAPVRAAAKPAGAPAGLGSGVGAWITGVGRGLVLAGLVLALGLTVLRWGVAGPAWKTGGVVPPGRLTGRCHRIAYRRYHVL